MDYESFYTFNSPSSSAKYLEYCYTVEIIRPGKLKMDQFDNFDKPEAIIIGDPLSIDAIGIDCECRLAPKKELCRPKAWMFVGLDDQMSKRRRGKTI